MRFAKPLGGAFLVGGIFGLLGQGLAMIYWQVPFLEGNQTIALLLTMGVLGGVLFATGAWDKIEKIGEMGATLPFVGLGATMSGITFGTKMKTGSLARGVWVAFKEIMLKVVGATMIILMIVSAAIFFLDGGSTHLGADALAFAQETGAPAAVPAYVSIMPNAAGDLLTNMLTVHDPSLAPATLAFSFLGVGAFSALMQLAVMLTGVTVPTLFSILIVAGGLLTIPGCMSPVLDTLGGGAQVVIMDFGQATVQLFCFALAGGVPGPMPFIMVIALLLALDVIGALGAIARAALLSKNGPKADTPRNEASAAHTE